MVDSSLPPDIGQGGISASEEERDVKRLVHEYLEAEIGLKSEQTTDFDLRRRLGKIFAWIAAVVPLIMLAVLVYQMFHQFPAFKDMDKEMNDLSKVIFISASFLCFIVIYTVLIKGMFQRQKDEEKNSPIKEAIQLLREYRSGGE